MAVTRGLWRKSSLTRPRAPSCRDRIRRRVRALDALGVLHGRALRTKQARSAGGRGPRCARRGGVVPRVELARRTREAGRGRVVVSWRAKALWGAVRVGADARRGVGTSGDRWTRSTVGV